jgi:hypothetical protein
MRCGTAPRLITNYCFTEIASSGSHLQDPKTDARKRSRNYQSALVRITMAGFIDCSDFSALLYLLPIGKEYPTHRIVGRTYPQKIWGRLQSAVQWLAGPSETLWVYKRCLENPQTYNKKDRRPTWCMKHWRKWKAQLQFYADVDVTEDPAREAAREALGRR